MKLRSVVAATLLVAAVATAQGSHEHHPPAPREPMGSAPVGALAALPPELRELFRLEMAALQGAMLELLPAVIAGDWGTIGRIAGEIRSGFVLSRRLTEAQREELHRVLPPSFLERDGDFHRLADGLEAAARGRSPELTSFYVYRLVEGCVGCHSRFAQERFPAFAPPAPAHAH